MGVAVLFPKKATIMNVVHSPHRAAVRAVVTGCAALVLLAACGSMQADRGPSRLVADPMEASLKIQNPPKTDEPVLQVSHLRRESADKQGVEVSHVDPKPADDKPMVGPHHSIPPPWMLPVVGVESITQDDGAKTATLQLGLQLLTHAPVEIGVIHEAGCQVPSHHLGHYSQLTVFRWDGGTPYQVGDPLRLTADDARLLQDRVNLKTKSKSGSNFEPVIFEFKLKNVTTSGADLTKVPLQFEWKVMLFDKAAPLLIYLEEYSLRWPPYVE